MTWAASLVWNIFCPIYFCVTCQKLLLRCNRSNLCCQMFAVHFTVWLEIKQSYQKDLTCENITCSANSHALTNYSFSLCYKHESSSPGPIPWKPFNLVLQGFYQKELSLYWQWVNHQRHSLYYFPLKSFEFQCHMRTVQELCVKSYSLHRLNDGGETFTGHCLVVDELHLRFKRDHIFLHMQQLALIKILRIHTADMFFSNEDDLRQDTDLKHIGLPCNLLKQTRETGCWIFMIIIIIHNYIIMNVKNLHSLGFILVKIHLNV